MFEQLHGPLILKEYLLRALEEDSLPQTLLFEGVEGVGKSLFAKELAAHVLNTKVQRVMSETHPDLHILRPEGKTHAIDDLRKWTDQVYEAPFEAGRKVFIIYDAERMQAPSANALLKTLEEPPLDTVIILLTGRAEEMLPTVLSRCVQLHFPPLPTSAIAEILSAHGLSPHFAKFAQGSAELALLLAKDETFTQMQRLLLDLVSKPIFYPDLLDGLEKIETLLEPLKEEQPAVYCRQVELLFASLLMWARDQVLFEIGGGEPFFPEESKTKRDLSLSAFEYKLQEAKTSFQRNIKLSTCLQHCLCSFGGVPFSKQLGFY
ncbi:MAG: DNA polymerase III subunit delta' [Chlamydiales bacterium]|nr:DNA polymerase III subunit delta' [Chlamydiales bacterium]